MIDFGGERVLITGAGGGVGRALVEVFSDMGAAVVASDVVGAELASDRIAEAHHFDLLDERALDDALKRIVENGAPVAVVLNAGWTRAESLDDVTEDLLAAEMNLNFKSGRPSLQVADPGDAQAAVRGILRLRLPRSTPRRIRQSRLCCRQGRRSCLDACDRDRGR